MTSKIDKILESDEYAEWVENNAYHYGYLISNGNNLMDAMEDDDIILAYLRHINFYEPDDA